nr:PREDICTED: protein FAM186A-like isoform X2 [Lepisosteus oculatus]
MDVKDNLSDLDLETSLKSSNVEVPYSVQVVLKKIEFSQLHRAKRDVGESLRAVLRSVNLALHHVRLGSALEAERGGRVTPGSDAEEKRKRAQQLEGMALFLQSSYDKETELGCVLRWMTETGQALQEVQEDEEYREVREITEEWVEEMEEKIEKSLGAIQGCIDRLSRLCTLLFELDTKSSKKKQAAIHKGGVWRWWRESKVDAKMVMKIQELQPPGVERLLQDSSLGIRTVAELSFMISDIAKSLSCKKALSLAFKFIQKGLQNISGAFQERTKENLELAAQLQSVRSEESRPNLERLKTEVEALKKKAARLEKELACAEGKHAALLGEMEKEASPVVTKTALIVVPEESLLSVVQEEAKQTPPAPSPVPKSKKTEAVKKKKKPKDVAVPPVEPEHIKSSPPVELAAEEEIAYVEPSFTLEEEVLLSEDEGTAASHQNDGIMEEMEKISTRLLQNFQKAVLNVAERSLLTGQGVEDQPKRAADAVALYDLLEQTIQSAFSKLVSELHGTFTDRIVKMPHLDDNLGAAGFWEDTPGNPGDMLKEISKMFNAQDRHLEETGTKMKALLGPDGRKDAKLGPHQIKTLQSLLDQLNDVQGMGKIQLCKLRLVLESLLDIHQQMSLRPKEQVVFVEKAIVEAGEPKHIMAPGLEQREEGDQAARIQTETSVASSQGTQRRVRMSRAKPKTLKEDVARYKKEMPEEGEHLLNTRMAGTTFLVDVESQKTNLRLLQQALRRGDISTQLYSLASDLIIRALSTDELRLVCLFRKYTAYYYIQKVRYNLNVRLTTAKDLNNGKSVKDLYSFLKKLDVFQEAVLQRWAAKQATINQIHKVCFAHMLYLFSQMREDTNLHLVSPFPSSCETKPSLQRHFLSRAEPRKLVWSLSPGRPPHSLPALSRPVTLRRLDVPGPVLGTREPLHGHLQPLWDSNVAARSYGIVTKTPVTSGPLLADVPRLLELDINQGRRAALWSLQARPVSAETTPSRIMGCYQYQ